MTPASPRSAVAWAANPLGAFFGTRLRPMQKPPVLLISFPRSGSSWIGQLLATASNAAYLHEPINRSCRDASQPLATGDTPESHPVALRASRLAFSGIPDFPEYIVRRPSQWGLLDRPRKKVVIKEVLLHLLPWLHEHYEPLTLLLVRHPNAVGQSYVRHGWLDANDTGACTAFATRLKNELVAALAVAGNDPAAHVFRYEDFCLRPRDTLATLFDHSGLQWADATDQLLEETTRADGQEAWQPYGIRRDPRRKAWEWKEADTRYHALFDILEAELGTALETLYAAEEWSLEAKE